jgi:hypothetical protein
MFTRLLTACSTALVLALFFAASPQLQAQDKKPSIDDALKSVMPAEAGGSRIDESQRVWAYVAAVVGFIVVFVVAWFCIRVLAFFVVIACFLGGIGLVCAAVHEKSVTTWEQLGVVVLCVGVFAGAAAVTANLYAITGGVEGKP